MATSKIKGTNAKIKELKGIKPEKVTDEQLKNVQDLVNEINRAQMELGQIETRKHAMLHNVAGLQEKLTKLQDEFQVDYGTSDINVQDGTINYNNEQANKKD